MVTIEMKEKRVEAWTSLLFLVRDGKLKELIFELIPLKWLPHPNIHNAHTTHKIRLEMNGLHRMQTPCNTFDT